MERQMLEVFREFTFEAAHSVPPYSGVHGHSFCVEVVVRGDPDPKFGWAVSLSDIGPRLRQVQQQLDHKFLNDIEGLEVPSLENLARWIWRRLVPELPHLHRICIRRGYGGRGEGCVLSAPVDP